jgi:uncharacterized protein YjbI with pentapeptide repeats
MQATLIKILAVSLTVLPFVKPAVALEAANQDTPANVTLDQVKIALAGAKPGHPADLAGKSLRNLDLSGLDFTGADLAHANLFGAKLADANLTGADLSGANLNLSWLIHANFTDANLTGASLVAPVVAQNLDAQKGEIPIFKGANLTGARVQARFTGGDLRGAKFTGGDVSAHLNNQSMGLMHTEMGSADLAGADFSHANLGHADLSFADLHGARFTGADLTRADLTGADASGADFAGANLDGTEMADTKLFGATGLAGARNLKQARGYKPPS